MSEYSQQCIFVEVCKQEHMVEHTHTHQKVLLFKTSDYDSCQLSDFIPESNSIYIPFVGIHFEVLKQSQFQFGLLLSKGKEIIAIHEARKIKE